MNAKALIGSVVLAIAAGATGCAVDSPPDEPQVSTVDEDVVIWCGDYAFREEYFSDPEMTILIGSRSCACGGQVKFVGDLNGYGKLIFKRLCDFN